MQTKNTDLLRKTRILSATTTLAWHTTHRSVHVSDFVNLHKVCVDCQRRDWVPFYANAATRKNTKTMNFIVEFEQVQRPNGTAGNSHVKSHNRSFDFVLFTYHQFRFEKQRESVAHVKRIDSIEYWIGYSRIRFRNSRENRFDQSLGAKNYFRINRKSGTNGWRCVVRCLRR